MTFNVIPNRVQIPGRTGATYQSCDGTILEDLEEMIEYDNKIHSAVQKPIYDSVSTIQEAINMAVAEGRVVRFLSKEGNLQMKKHIFDIKGCKLRKPDKESNDVAIIPLSIDPDTFDFNAVDTSLVVSE